MSHTRYARDVQPIQKYGGPETFPYTGDSLRLYTYVHNKLLNKKGPAEGLPDVYM